MSKSLPEGSQLHIRSFMFYRDYEQVAEMVKDDCGNSCFKDGIENYYKHRKSIVLVAELHSPNKPEWIVSLVAYEWYRFRLDILSFVVVKDMRRHGIGTAFMERLFLKSEDPSNLRTHVVLEVHAGNLPAQQFGRACGFKAPPCIDDNLGAVSEDTYVMIRFNKRAKNRRKLSGMTAASRLVGSGVFDNRSRITNYFDQS